jgi:hypothetical protein
LNASRAKERARSGPRSGTIRSLLVLALSASSFAFPLTANAVVRACTDPAWTSYWDGTLQTPPPIGYANNYGVAVTVNDEDAQLCQPYDGTSGYSVWPMIGSGRVAGYQQGYAQDGYLREPYYGATPKFFFEWNDGGCLAGTSCNGSPHWYKFVRSSPAWTVHANHIFYVKYAAPGTYSGCYGGCLRFIMDQSELGITNFNPGDPNGYWASGWQASYSTESHDLGDDVPEVVFSGMKWQGTPGGAWQDFSSGQLAATNPRFGCAWVTQYTSFWTWTVQTPPAACG